MTGHRSGRKLREEIGHPILDADGHSIEFQPLLLEYLRELGSAEIVDRYAAHVASEQSKFADIDRRRAARTPAAPWWTRPAMNTRDRATPMLPGLMAERLDEIGLDHSVVYPSIALGFPRYVDPDLRRALCRAVNTMRADQFRPFADRLTPVAVIPAHSPDEAREELDHAIGQLGMKAIVLPSHVARTNGSDSPSPGTTWIDNLVIDSQHDYDPLWQACVDWKVVPTFHSSGMWGTRSTPSNYVYNHVGHFASSAEIICKSLLMGGVTRRFPSLRFGFLEGGCGWAVNLLSDLVGHWEKRGGGSVKQYNPMHIDRDQLSELIERYGDAEFRKVGEQLGTVLDAEARNGPAGTLSDDPSIRARSDQMDDFDAAGMTTVDDFIDRFVEPFYFGCEADDPMTALAFDPRFRLAGRDLKAMLSSDIGHWDVTDISEVLAEAYEGCEAGLMSADEFRAFALDNAVRMYTDVNPAFFDGTTLEDAARASVDFASTGDGEG